MLQYLIILLDKTSASYCHYEAPLFSAGERELMPLETLRKGITFAMKENLNIQFVFPDYTLPEDYNIVIESIDHSKIKPETQAMDADVLVLNKWKDDVCDKVEGVTCIIHANLEDLMQYTEVVEGLLKKVRRLNVVLKDVEAFRDKDIGDYQEILEKLSATLLTLYKQGHIVQLNLLTDRLFLKQMNNCSAGVSNITLAPNGCFYLCPAFYYDDPLNNVGSLAIGVNIKNRQLLQLDHAPICRTCDAFQCKRCIWMNSILTLDANTPSHQQCVMAHIERNASRDLLGKMDEAGIRMSETHEITEIDYLDPFNNYKQWK